MKIKNNKPFYSVKLIFQDGWSEYLKTHKVRDIEKLEVEKMLYCKDDSREGFWHYCKTCDEYLFLLLGCIVIEIPFNLVPYSLGIVKAQMLNFQGP